MVKARDRDTWEYPDEIELPEKQIGMGDKRGAYIEDECPVHHGATQRLWVDEETGEKWLAHRLSDGTWCNNGVINAFVDVRLKWLELAEEGMTEK